MPAQVGRKPHSCFAVRMATDMLQSMAVHRGTPFLEGEEEVDKEEDEEGDVEVTTT